MSFIQLKYLINSDLYRYTGKISLKSFISNYIIQPGFRYSVMLRICNYFKDSIIRFAFFPLLYHYRMTYGICISHKTEIGSGFYIGHFGNIIVHNDVVIGKNCNMSHKVTIGQANRGPRKGIPIIGDNVFVGTGAIVLGNIKVGNNVAIGANCVVTKDVPDNAVVAGVPGKIISYKGSKHYVNNTDYK